MTSARRQFIVLLGVCYALIAIFVISPKYSWVHPEIGIYDTFTLTDPSWAITKTFNWEKYEFAPRVTRPISNFLQILECEVRHAVLPLLPYIPVFSPLAWFLCLIATPYLMYRFLLLLGLSNEVAGAGFLVAMMNPANLSHIGVYFRPAKALSEFFLMCTAVCFARLLQKNKISWKEAATLGGLLLFAFLSDEYGANAYLFVLVFSAAGLWRLRKKLGPVMIGVPVVLAILYFVVFPLLSYAFWGLRGGVTDYFVLGNALHPENARSTYGALASLSFSYFLDHLWIFPTETFGVLLVPWPKGWGLALLTVNAIAFAVFAGFAVQGFWKSRDHAWLKRLGALLMLFILGIAFHSLLMGMTQGPFGPWYYAGADCLFLVMIYCWCLKWAPKSAVFVLVAPMLLTNVYVFTFTNQMMKKCHYYPNSLDFEDMFVGDIDRFEVPKVEVIEVSELKRILAMKPGDCRAVPVEHKWILGTGLIQREPAKTGLRAEVLCAGGSTCCSGDKRIQCELACGHF